MLSMSHLENSQIEKHHQTLKVQLLSKLKRIDIINHIQEQLTYPIQVVCGSNHIISRNDRGKVTIMGNNPEGQCRSKQLNGNSSISNLHALDVFAGSNTTFILTQNGLTCQGDNRFGQSNIPAMPYHHIDQIQAGGCNTIISHKDGLFSNQGLNPQPELRFMRKDNIKQISNGENHCLVLSNGGFVMGLGKGSWGQLSIPEELQGTIVQVSAGHTHSLLMTDTGSILSIGSNLYGQFITKNVKNFLWGERKVRKIVAGGVFSAVLTESNELQIVGGLGQGIDGPGDEQAGYIVDVSCGYAHQAALDVRGDIVIGGEINKSNYK